MVTTPTPSARPALMRGLIAAPYTPFDSKTGDVKLDVIERYAESLIADGITGAFVCGTTGEGLSLTIEERQAVARRWVEVAGTSLNVFVHVGDLSQRNAVTLAAHAREIGAAGVAAMPAFFFKPASVAHLVDFCRPIAAAAGEVPFYYYHIPSMSGVTTSIVEFLALGTKQIPNFRGVKFTHADLMEFQRCQTAFGDSVELAWGVDEILVGALALGATAAVGSTYNYAAPLYGKMVAAHRAGDMATVHHCSSLVCEMVAVLIRNGVLRTGKATMEMIGIDCGPPRAPLAPLSREEAASVRDAYDRLGVLTTAKTAARPRHAGNGSVRERVSQA